MKLSRKVQKALMASAVIFAMGSGVAWAAPVDTGFGACTGASGTDCTAATGHASMSVTSTLSINEMRALSFGNFAATTPGATDTIVLDIDGSRTASTGFTPLNGANATGGSVGGATGSALETGSQSAGHFTISGGSEDAATATQVYISFADSSGNGIDMCDDSTHAICDDYHHGNVIQFQSPTGGVAGDLTMDKFVINQSGSDVYGHYIDNSGTTVGPGISDPWLPGANHSGGASAGGVAGEVDVVVGATLHGTGAALNPGKYTATYVVMASY